MLEYRGPVYRICLLCAHLKDEEAERKTARNRYKGHSLSTILSPRASARNKYKAIGFIDDPDGKGAQFDLTDHPGNHNTDMVRQWFSRLQHSLSATPISIFYFANNYGFIVGGGITVSKGIVNACGSSQSAGIIRGNLTYPLLYIPFSQQLTSSSWNASKCAKFFWTKSQLVPALWLMLKKLITGATEIFDHGASWLTRYTTFAFTIRCCVSGTIEVQNNNPFIVSNVPKVNKIFKAVIEIRKLPTCSMTHQLSASVVKTLCTSGSKHLTMICYTTIWSLYVSPREEHNDTLYSQNK